MYTITTIISTLIITTCNMKINQVLNDSNLDEEESSDAESLSDSCFDFEAASDSRLALFLVSNSNSDGESLSLSLLSLAASFLAFLRLFAKSICLFSSCSLLCWGESESLLELSELLDDRECCRFLSLGLLGLIHGSCQAASPPGCGAFGFFISS